MDSGGLTTFLQSSEILPLASIEKVSLGILLRTISLLNTLLVHFLDTCAIHYVGNSCQIHI